MKGDTPLVEDLVQAAQDPLPLVHRDAAGLEGLAHVVTVDVTLLAAALDERDKGLGFGDLRRERTGRAERHKEPLVANKYGVGGTSSRELGKQTRGGSVFRAARGHLSVHRMPESIRYALN